MAFVDEAAWRRSVLLAAGIKRHHRKQKSGFNECHR